MAIPFLNHLDLRSVSELQNAILHKTTESSASDVRGKLIYDTGTDTIKYYSKPDGVTGTWISLTGDTNTFRTVQADGTAIGATETLNLIGGTNITLSESGGAITINAGASTTVGKSNSSQRSGSIELLEGSNVTITEDSTTGHFTFASTNTNQLTTFTLRDDDNDEKTVAHGKFVKFAAATGASGTEITGTGTTTDPFLITITSPDTTTDVDVNKTNLKARLAQFDSTDTVYIGDAGDDTTVVIRGTLQVDGTTTTVNSETLTIDDNKIVLNDNVTGTPTEDAGIVIERGNQTNTELRWNESDDDWEYTAFNHAGSPALTTYKIPTTFKGAVGDSSASAGSYSEAVTHNLGSRDVIVQLYDASSYETVHADVVRTDANTVTLTFASAPTNDDVTVLISKVG